MAIAVAPRLICRSRRLFFFNDTATTEIYTLSLHDALPISSARRGLPAVLARPAEVLRRSSPGRDHDQRRARRSAHENRDRGYRAQSWNLSSDPHRTSLKGFAVTAGFRPGDIFVVHHITMLSQIRTHEFGCPWAGTQMVEAMQCRELTRFRVQLEDLLDYLKDGGLDVGIFTFFGSSQKLIPPHKESSALER